MRRWQESIENQIERSIEMCCAYLLCLPSCIQRAASISAACSFHQRLKSLLRNIDNIKQYTTHTCDAGAVHPPLLINLHTCHTAVPVTFAFTPLYTPFISQDTTRTRREMDTSTTAATAPTAATTATTASTTNVADTASVHTTTGQKIKLAGAAAVAKIVLVCVAGVVVFSASFC